MVKTLIIFDIDETLVCSNRLDSQCFATTYEELYGKTFPGIDWHSYPHVTDTAIINWVIRNHFNRLATKKEMLRFQDHFVALLELRRKENPANFQEVPFAKITIDRLLADSRYVVGIATGGWEKPAKVKLRHVGIPEDRLVMSCADGKTTREAILREIIDSVALNGLEIRHSVYVGDARWDVQTTRNLNLNFLGIRREGDFDVLEKEGSTQVFQDYQNYEGFLEMVAVATPPLTLYN